MKKFLILSFIGLLGFNTAWAMEEMQDADFKPKPFDMSEMRKALDELIYPAQNQSFAKFTNDVCRKYEILNAELANLGILNQEVTRFANSLKALKQQPSLNLKKESDIYFEEITLCYVQNRLNDIPTITLIFTIYSLTKIISNEKFLYLYYLIFAGKIKTFEDIPDYIVCMRRAEFSQMFPQIRDQEIKSRIFLSIQEKQRAVEYFYAKIKQDPCLEKTYNDLISGAAMASDNLMDLIIETILTSLQMTFNEEVVAFIRDRIKIPMSNIIRICGNMGYIFTSFQI